MINYDYENYSNEEMTDLLTKSYVGKTVKKIECSAGLMVIHFTDEDTLTIEVEELTKKFPSV